MGLAKEFMSKIGDGFDQVDARPDSFREVLTKGDEKPNSSIPDGEELIMGVLVTKEIPLNHDIITIKQPYGLDILLSDFFSTADFAIYVDNENGAAQGWYIKEDQKFALDVKSGTVTIKENTYRLNEGDVFYIDEELFVKSTALESWFSMKFNILYDELQIFVKSKQPLPAVDRYNRRNRDISQRRLIGDPTLPFEEQSYSAFDFPSMDVNIRGSHYNSSTSDAQNSASWSVLGAGDFAYLNTKTFISGDEEDAINNVRLTFGRESEESDLLGPLNARRFEFGDVSTARLQVSGGSNQEQGVYISNKPSNVISNRNTTVFRGDAQPGWDVELYRNDRILAFQTVSETGQYEFQDVELFSGDNEFKIVLLGPQGEVQELTESIPVNSNSYAAGRDYYELSVSRNNEITYRANDFEQPQDGELHIVGRYEKGLTDNLTVTTGIQSRDEGDERRNYVEAGVSTALNDVFLDFNTAYEATESEMGAELVARKSINRHALRGSVFASTDGFQPGTNDEQNPITLQTELSVNGPLQNFFGLKNNYGLTQSYDKRSDGSHNLDLGASMSTRLKRVVLNNRLNYEQNKDATGVNDDFLRYIFNARGFYKGGFMRFTGNYDISPDAKLRQLFASYNYPFSKTLDGLFEIEHDLDPSRTEFTSSLNWKADKATISPRISVDTEDVVQASVNVRFGVAHNPVTNDTSIFNQRLSNAGGVAARIFVDANGNGLFDDGEELVEGAELNAVQVKKEGFSDENGIAFIPNLPRGRITDIKVDPSSLADPYWMPNYEGLSLRPRPGKVKELDFPLVVSGEIDGTIYFVSDGGEKTPARQFKVHLIAPWGDLVKTTSTAYDGFYILGEIPPGIYYLVVDYKDAENTGYMTPPPQRVELKPDGTTIFGNDILLNKGDAVPFKFTSDIEPTGRKNRRVLQATGDSKVSIRLGPFKSKLSATLNMYKFKRSGLGRNIPVTSPLSGLERSTEDHLFWINTGFSSPEIESAQEVCQNLKEKSINCEVNVHTDAYNDNSESDASKG
jgi:hypothetical protein